MFSVFSFKKSILDTGLLQDMTDIHSHLLPGVDDGMEDASSSYDACRYLQSIGVRRIFLTSHIMEDLPDNRPAALKEKYRSYLVQNPTGIEFRLAGEYMLDNGFMSQLEEGVLTIGEKYVLVETSYLGAYPEARNMLYELCVRGYQPLIAHPERYLYLPLEVLERMKDKRYSFQLNLMSLAGVYGKDVQKRAVHLLKSGFYDFVGSDIHNLRVYRHALASLYLSKEELHQLERLLENNRSLP